MTSRAMEEHTTQKEITWESIRISGFRGIRQMEISGLEPLCFITGPNGAGKTSVIDALEIYASRANPGILRKILARSDDNTMDQQTGKTYPDQDALFHQRADRQEIRIGPGNPELEMTIGEDLNDTSIRVSLAGKKMRVSLEDRENHRTQTSQQITPMDYRRLGPEPAGNSTIAEMWYRICLTDREQGMVQVLAETLGIPIARLGCTGDGPHRRPIVRLEGEPQTIPLRRLGQGPPRPPRS